MAEKQVLSLSHTHESVMNFMLLNPSLALREVADHFGYTQAWLSTLIHSDLFQAQFESRKEGIRVRVADSIPQKMRLAADLGMEKLVAKLEQTEDPEFILDATDKLLHRLGYAPSKVAVSVGGAGVANQQNNFYISAADLDKAKAAMGLAALRPMLPDTGSPTCVGQAAHAALEPLPVHAAAPGTLEGEKA